MVKPPCGSVVGGLLNGEAKNEKDAVPAVVTRLLTVSV